MLYGLFTYTFKPIIGHLDVSENRGTPKWMVKIMENPIKMDDLGGRPTIFGKHPFIIGVISLHL